MSLYNGTGASGIPSCKDKLLIVVCPIDGEIVWDADNMIGSPRATVRRLARTIQHVLTERNDFQVCVAVNYNHQDRYTPTLAGSMEGLAESVKAKGFEPPEFLQGVRKALSHVTFFADMPEGDAFENSLFAKRVREINPQEIYVCGFLSTSCVLDTASGRAGGKKRYNFIYLHDISGPPDTYHARAIRTFASKGIGSASLLCQRPDSVRITRESQYTAALT